VDGCVGLFSRGGSAIRAELRSSVAAAQAGSAFVLIAKKPCARVIESETETWFRANSCDAAVASLLHPKTQRFSQLFRWTAAPFFQPENRSFKGLRIRQFL
jgi:hypothetical protein